MAKNGLVINKINLNIRIGPINKSKSLLYPILFNINYLFLSIKGL